ncbi:hypothetical protein KVR01_001057 [Diaporthe batatas]|uniref:uncharacterized protein n=1 Tax=Diaporthe batatas TaxID=748121 RepID=UPI001D03D0E6|nr:uncharacterized protein KVR01_001057 [Diaporthe batatas]KAG8170312.1 hypothetical protein KVR01_001057 [Diaporthe batatas]
MEQYRIFCPGSSNDCKSLAYIGRLHGCIWPRLALDSDDFFESAEAESTKGTMFFSLEETKALFTKENIMDLLSCRCRDCGEYKSDASAAFNLLDYEKRIVNQNDEGWLLMAALVYLGKLSLIYRWIQHPHMVEPGTLRGARSLVEAPFPTRRQNELFWKAYGRVMDMFSPLEIKPGINDRPEHNSLAKSQRFPYLDEPGSLPSGSSGSLITAFCVPEEYLHVDFRQLMENNYSNSVVDDGRGKKYRLVRKVLTHKTLKHMEHITLRMIASRRDQVNLINLMALYEWREQIHFIFPFVETHLDEVLLDQWTFPGSAQTRALADNALWRQMIGVCEALKTIHFDLTSPWGSKNTQVIAFHFDLKPANLLVTANGIVKITDFGHSMIQIMLPEKEKKGFYRGGDPVYRAPESTPDSEQVREARETRNHTAISQDYNKELPRSQVFLNYDVWQLACIMTEVLIWITETDQYREKDLPGEKGQVIKAFRQEKRDEDGQDAFFRVKSQNGTIVRCLKTAVDEKLRSIQSGNMADTDVETYMARTVEILRGMFEIDPHRRYHSYRVLRELEEASQRYSTSRQRPGDRIYQKIRDWNPSKCFTEVGWKKGGEIRSFLEMSDVRIRNKMPRETIRECTCMFRVFYKQGTVLIFHGVGERDELDTMPFNPQLLKLDMEKSYMIPEYLYRQPDGRFTCTVISGDQPYEILSLSFASRDGKYRPRRWRSLWLTAIDAQRFQHALTRQKVEWESDIGHVERANFYIKPKKQDADMSRNLKLQVWSCWKDGICDIDFNSTRHLHSPDRREYAKQRLVIFEDLRPFFLIPFNNGQKQFLCYGHAVTIKAARRFKECDLYRSPSKFPCIEDTSVNEDIEKLGCVAPAVPLDQLKLESRSWRLAGDLKRRPSVLTFSRKGDADMFEICKIAAEYGEAPRLDPE